MNTTKTNTTETTKAMAEIDTAKKVNSEIDDIAARLQSEIGDITARLQAEIGDIKVEVNPTIKIEINPTFNIKTGDINITNCNNKNDMEDITNLVKVLLNR